MITPEMGGGTQFEDFEEPDQMHDRVQDLLTTKKNVTITVAGYMDKMFKYEPVEVALVYQPTRI